MRERPLSLAEFRRRLGRSQAEIAAGAGTTQSGVSRTERQADMLISTLDEYVSALGGKLRLAVEHPAISTELTVPILQDDSDDEVVAPREYRVIWQEQVSRALVHVGWLAFTGDSFSFTYTDEARSHPDFEPFPPFPQFETEYRSGDLFPFFAIRIISAADPDFDVAVDALGLTRDQATPAELLARSPATSPHDTIQVIPEPIELADGSLVRRFLVSGVRHADEQQPEVLSEIIGRLRPDTELQLAAEPSNTANSQALQLVSGDDVLGWVPNYLLGEIHQMLDQGRDLRFEVERANGPEAPWHLRLLCRLTISAPARS